MSQVLIALFGEAEKGAFKKGFLCQELPELVELFGNPPPDSLGLFYATQALLYHYPLIFFRVEQEGFSRDDYLNGIQILESSSSINLIRAICMPGVGDHKIINALLPLCYLHHQILITTERDLFDYLLER